VFATLSSFIHRRPWRVVIAAILFVLVAGVLGGNVAGSLQSGGFNDPGAQSTAALNRLEQAAGTNRSMDVIALIRTGQAVQSAATRSEVAGVATILRRDPGIARVLTVYKTHNPAMISANGKETYVIAEVRNIADNKVKPVTDRLSQALQSDPYVTLGGGAFANVQVSDTVSQDLARSELLAFPLLFILLLVVFRGVVAAFFPVVMGMVTVLGGFLGLRLVNEFTPLSVFAVNLVTGLGLGLSIDYSLLIVSRYREEMARNGPDLLAVRRTLSTAGRTVLFSSLTVAAAMASLMVFPENFLRSMGIGGVLVTLVASLVALTLLPAVLVLLGTRVNALAPKRWQRPPSADDASGFWYRLSHFVMRRAVLVAVVTSALLIVLGAPFLGIKFTSVDASVLPRSDSARQVNDVLNRDFASNQLSPIYITIEAPLDRSPAAQLQAFTGRIRSLPGVAQVLPARPAGRDTWELDVVSKAGMFSDRARTLVKDIRALSAPFSFQVGGNTATFVDLQASLARSLPIALAIIALVTIAMLFLVTGSVILPFKTILMTLLSLSATFGILVLIFQDGNLEGLLQYTGQGALESTQPVLLFALAFGLSTDYSVFLLSRIKEQHDAGLDNTEAVATGLARTGRIVTSAAVLFCVAIGAFATGHIVFMKELGIGTALAVLIDATIVRALLVPALMRLLGEWNWYAPTYLRRLQQRVQIEVPAEPATREPVAV
jgi:RND superfamily putative drug exporter